MSILEALGLAAPVAVGALNAKGIGRRRPILRNAQRANRRLDGAFDQHLDDIKPGAQLTYDIAWNKPNVNATTLEHINDVRNNGLKYASSSSPSQKPAININPNADRAYLAHEMGHLASQQTDVGHLVASLRENPKLKTALLGAMVTIPGVAAALEAGDDDMDSSIALAALASAPTLIDEGLATRHGLAIMDKAGLRANLGQRGKLAGGLLSYLAPAIIAGSAGNFAGNLFDQDV